MAGNHHTLVDVIDPTDFPGKTFLGEKPLTGLRRDIDDSSPPYHRVIGFFIQHKPGHFTGPL